MDFFQVISNVGFYLLFSAVLLQLSEVIFKKGGKTK